MKQSINILISGGGTGGHIYPAIAIANELKVRYPEAKFLFVGAKDKMEMEKVPEAGYQIIGLWISGIQRKLSFKNLLFPLRLLDSLLKAAKIIKKFKKNKNGMVEIKYPSTSTVFMRGRLRHPFRFYANSEGTVCAIICEITLRMEGLYSLVSSILDWAENTVQKK